MKYVIMAIAFMLVVTYTPLPATGEDPFEVEQGEGWIRVFTGRMVVTVREGGVISLSPPGEEASLKLTISRLYSGDKELHLQGSADLEKTPWQLATLRAEGDLVEIEMKKDIEIMEEGGWHHGGGGMNSGMGGPKGGGGGSVDISVLIKVFRVPRMLRGEAVGGLEEVKMDFVISPHGVEGERLYLEQHLGGGGISHSKNGFRWEAKRGMMGRSTMCSMGGVNRELYRYGGPSEDVSVACRLDGGDDEVGAYSWRETIAVNRSGGGEDVAMMESYIGGGGDVVVFSYPLQNNTRIVHDPLLRLNAETMKKLLRALYQDFLEHLSSVIAGVIAGSSGVLLLSVYVRRRRKGESPLSSPYLREPPHR